MPVRIRLSRGGAKKHPFYRIVVADSRRSRDGKFIDQLGTYNPMLAKDNPERIKLDADKAKDWIAKGAQPSDRVKIFLSNINLIDKPIITEKTKKHLPKKKEEKPAEEKPKEEAKEVKEEKPAEEKPKEEAKEKKDK
jgi:small subunit ribosomal protein S16